MLELLVDAIDIEEDCQGHSCDHERGIIILGGQSLLRNFCNQF